MLTSGRRANASTSVRPGGAAVGAGGWRGRRVAQLFLRSGADTITGLRTLPASGDYNTVTVGDFGGPWAACLAIPNQGEVCTAHAW
ncbi:hypothetical protein GCM10027176_44420 [Actinoallomurus bryophytorum]